MEVRPHDRTATGAKAMPAIPETTRSSGGRSLAASITLCALLAAPIASAQQNSGCFSGHDHLGHPARVFLSVERYGDWFEIAGQIQSAGTGQTYRFKADGHSGAGRIFARHEYESGAAFIQIIDLNQSIFVLQVDGYGVFRYQRSRC